MTIAGFEPGDAFDPQSPPPPPPDIVVEDIPADAPEWTSQQLQSILRGAFVVGDFALGPALCSVNVEHQGGRVERHRVASLHAHDDELRAMADPLARILNRHPVMRALAGHADAAELAMAFFGYGGRVGREKLSGTLELQRRLNPPQAAAPAPAPAAAPVHAPHPAQGDIAA